MQHIDRRYPEQCTLTGRLMWLLPLVAGVVGWVWPLDSGDMPVSESAGKDRVREGVSPPPASVAEAFGSLEQQVASGQEKEAEDLTKLDGTALRARLLALKDKPPSPDDWSEWEAYCRECTLVACELGKREGCLAIAWAEAELGTMEAVWKDGNVYAAVMTGAAQHDPAEVFDWVCASGRINPCSHALLSELLEKQAGGSPEALKAAASRVPWHLFQYVQDPFCDGGLYLPGGDSAQKWLDSGVARDLAGQGVRLNNVFGAWYTADPQAALESWAGWPRSNDLAAQADLMEMVRIAEASDAGGKAFEDLVEKADEETAARLLPMLTKIAKDHPRYLPRLHARMPNLFPEGSPKP